MTSFRLMREEHPISISPPANYPLVRNYVSSRDNFSIVRRSELKSVTRPVNSERLVIIENLHKRELNHGKDFTVNSVCDLRQQT